MAYSVVCEAYTEEWYQQRQTGIGGSDVCILLGMKPQWQTPYALFQEKRGLGANAIEHPWLSICRRLEPQVLELYAEATGLPVVAPNQMLRSREDPWRFVTPDALVPAKQLVVEAKIVRSGQDWGEPWSDDIPQEYMVQVQHAMDLIGYPVTHLPVLVLGEGLRIYEVRADPELQHSLREAEYEFMTRVLDNDPPTPMSVAEANQRYQQVLGTSIRANQEIGVLIPVLKGEMHLAKATADDVEHCKLQIMNFMGEHDTLIDEDGKVLVTWKQVSPNDAFDTNQFKQDYPHLYEQYLQPRASYRRFLVK